VPVLITQTKGNTVNNYEQRQEEKREKYLARAEKARQASSEAYNASKSMSDQIPFGQPILVGHHSEGRHRRHLDKIHNKMGQSVKLDEKADYYERKAESLGQSGISSDDPEAVVKLKEKLEGLQGLQQLYKDTNKFLKKKDDAGLEKLGYSVAQIEALKTPDCMGRTGIASYQLTNNGANIRTVKKRIESLVKQENAPDFESIRHDDLGIDIVEDREDNRMRITFDEKPSREVCKIMKTNGWRYSPRNTAWQRLNNNATQHSIVRTVHALKQFQG